MIITFDTDGDIVLPPLAEKDIDITKKDTTYYINFYGACYAYQVNTGNIFSAITKINI